MNYEKLHEYSTGENQKIALIDSGVSNFLDFEMENSFSLVDKNIYDVNGHGTMMYSIIKGYDKEILGISPDAEVISIKILDEEESVTPKKIRDAIHFAIEKEVNVINLSVSSYKYNEEIALAIKEAIQKNITVVSSSGDYSDVKMMFPANVHEVVSVGALGENLKVLKMTSGADSTTINAPGGDIYSVNNSKEVFLSSGTSQATAIISGYIALIRDYADEENISLSNDDILHYLELINDEQISYEDVFKEMKKQATVLSSLFFLFLNNIKNISNILIYEC